MSSHKDAFRVSLVTAINNNNLELLHSLLCSPLAASHVNEADKNGQTAFFYAVDSSAPALFMLEFLKIESVNFLVTDSEANTVFHRACCNQSLEKIAILLTIGMPNNFLNNQGQTPLQMTKNPRVHYLFQAFSAQGAIALKTLFPTLLSNLKPISFPIPTATKRSSRPFSEKKSKKKERNSTDTPIKFASFSTNFKRADSEGLDSSSVAYTRTPQRQEMIDEWWKRIHQIRTSKFIDELTGSRRSGEAELQTLRRELAPPQNDQKRLSQSLSDSSKRQVILFNEKEKETSSPAGSPVKHLSGSSRPEPAQKNLLSNYIEAETRPPPQSCYLPEPVHDANSDNVPSGDSSEKPEKKSDDQHKGIPRRGKAYINLPLLVPDHTVITPLGDSQTFHADKDMNVRFQEATEKLFLLESMESMESGHGKGQELLAMYHTYVAITTDFLSQSQSVGRVIITETFLPAEKKTIKPTNLGGIIGGEKYVVHDILFKHALGKDKILTDEEAFKIAGHEIKSLVRIWETRTRGIFLPLQCVVDFLGLRLVAMLKLPIANDTLKVGTCDGGATMHSKEKQLLKVMNLIGKQLNLASHTFNGVKLYLPADCEGHIGTDGRKYLIDLSRTFPPAVRGADAEGMCHLFQLLRPELCKRFKKPLCNDLFSAFLTDPKEREKNYQRLVEAEAYLNSTLIPKAAEALDHLVPIFWSISRFERASGLTVGCILHQHGVNIRHIARVYEHTQTHHARWFIITELLSRCIKRHIQRGWREIMKQHPSISSTPYIEFLCKFINNVFWRTPEYVDLLAKCIQTYYRMNPEDTKIIFQYCWSLSFSDFIFGIHPSSPKQVLALSVAIRRAIHYLGVNVAPYFLSRLESLDAEAVYSEGESKRELISPACIISLQEKTKHINLIYHARGYILKRERDIKENIALKELAIENFEDALESSPLNKLTLRNLATAYQSLWRKEDGYTDLQKEYLHYLFNTSLESDPKDTHTLYQYASFLYDISDFQGAEDQLLKSIEADVGHNAAYLLYSQIVSRWGLKNEAQRISACLGIK